ncbi:copper chaperone CopZ [bacterium BMS3Bbin07]|nr:copper chaperone CopZ [bacterium BMS3Bbin07]HDH53183.1 copper chaperone [Nitrospirota bacterium]
MAEVTLEIEGMTCQHCVMRVKKAIDGIDGVVSSDVSTGSARVSYDDSRTDRDAIEKVIQDAGYKVRSKG